ncbi:hypothetical protein DPMN_159985 [Dreissena polymorpha]|uniref:Uncharacterized protein n=1 Tax=Dreissena polymorpha TaxID=45954 RepID=A0A9D4IR75_DREPO|nr:hypothetical protein DPMN_159985 [Dreissena polymorpha]
MKRTLGQELSTVLRKLNFQEHGKRKQRGKGRKNRLTLLSTSPKKLGLEKERKQKNRYISHLYEFQNIQKLQGGKERCQQ